MQPDSIRNSHPQAHVHPTIHESSSGTCSSHYTWIILRHMFIPLYMNHTQAHIHPTIHESSSGTCSSQYTWIILSHMFTPLYMNHPQAHIHPTIHESSSGTCSAQYTRIILRHMFITLHMNHPQIKSNASCIVLNSIIQGPHFIWQPPPLVIVVCSVGWVVPQ